MAEEYWLRVKGNAGLTFPKAIAKVSKRIRLLHVLHGFALESFGE